MTVPVVARPLDRREFAPYGDVIEKDGANRMLINNNTCLRYHDLAHVQLIGANARALISIFAPTPQTRPCLVELVERHPLGSQAFIPLTRDPFLIVVCENVDGAPVDPRAFVTNGAQGVNYHANVWHAPLIALAEGAEFLVVDRGGDGVNLEERILPDPLEIVIDP